MREGVGDANSDGGPGSASSRKFSIFNFQFVIFNASKDVRQFIEN
jgi:hypothetical protein